MNKPRYSGQFGNLVGLKPSNSTTEPTVTTTITKQHILNHNNNMKKKTKTMEISEQLYQRFLDHSSKYYNVETYEIILEDLLNRYDKHNQDKHWYNKNNKD
jgi:hypothetical protein